MQAVILVGGKGTRLRPLTMTLPKPMLPLLNRPFIEYVIKLLKNNGFDEIILSTGYLPNTFDCLQDNFSDIGVKVTCISEAEPLGTCGAVKNIESLIKDTFVVFNGDILTDINLKHLLSYHRQKQALATLALTSVDDPTSYGLVPLNSDGHVNEFLEKPSWDEVTTDLINAGVYILEPEVLSYAPAGENYSFERGLFPLLLEKGLPLFGFPTSAYWLDIGSPEKYLRAHYDMLDGKVGVDLDGEQVRPGIWIGKDSKIADTANLFGPVLIGPNCTIGENVSITGPTSIGDNCIVSDGVRIESSIILDDCKLSGSSVIKNSILARNISVGRKVHIEECSVLGDNMTVGDENWLKKGIKVWPETKIEPGTIKF